MHVAILQPSLLQGQSLLSSCGKRQQTFRYAFLHSVDTAAAVVYPVKLTVVQSVTRPLSPSILRNGQFSHPMSTNCIAKVIQCAVHRQHVCEHVSARKPDVLGYLAECLDQLA